jgi:hypothetical protein
MVGDAIIVAGAATGGTDLYTTIQAFTSSTSVELATAAGHNGSGSATVYVLGDYRALGGLSMSQTNPSLSGLSISASGPDTKLLTSTADMFVPGMEGDAITVAGAGSAGGSLVTTIATYINARNVELANDALTTVASGGMAMVTDAGTTLTSVTAPFQSSDVGKVVKIRGAGSMGADLSTTIASFVDESHVTTAGAASTTVIGTGSGSVGDTVALLANNGTAVAASQDSSNKVVSFQTPEFKPMGSLDTTATGSLANHGVVIGQGTSPMVATAAGAAASTVLIGNGSSADPSFSATPQLTRLGIGKAANSTLQLDIQGASRFASRVLNTTNPNTNPATSGGGISLLTTTLPTAAGAITGQVSSGTDDGTFITPTAVVFKSKEDWTTHRGSSIEFQMTPVGSSTPATYHTMTSTELTSPNLVDTGLTASRLVYSDANKQLASVTLGTGLSLSSGTLSSAGPQWYTPQSASLDFSSVAAQNHQDLTTTLTGAAAGDLVLVTPATAPDTGLVYYAWVSAADTVTVRAINYTGSSIDPPSRTFYVTALKNH